MPVIKIDGQEYESDSLPDEAKKQLQMLQYVETELVRLSIQTAVLQTARSSYGAALKRALTPPVDVFAGGTIQLG